MQISILPMNAIISKLGNASTGFNQKLDDVALATYGVPPFTISFPVDVKANPTTSFFFVQLDPEAILDSSLAKKDFMSLFIPSSDNQNFEKPRDFSGLVEVGLDVILSFLPEEMQKGNFESKHLAVEDAVTEVLQPTGQQNWGAGVVYNGEFNCQRSVLIEGGSESWYQVMAWRFTFQVDIGG